MKELLEYRVLMLKRLAKASQEFCAAAKEYSDPFIKVDGEWTVHQIVSHTRDVDKMIYGARVRRTLSEENPEFTSFDADAWMAEHYSKDEPLENILSEFSDRMDEMCSALNMLPNESWSRVSRHETLGEGLTLQLWVERTLAHIEEHLLTLKNAQK